ncbi:hypothetical protein CBS14141_002030 [Malassezia furfur]|nr:hypothetical protein CBS14141_002030 [Malassezia furfur]
MYTTHDLEDRAVRETLLQALQLGRDAPESRDRVTGARTPQIVQLAGDDPDALVRAARHVAPLADGIDLNLGCPQRRAKEGHYGGYLLHPRDWPLLDTIVGALAHATPLPVSVKIRLCDYAPDTPKLAVRLAHAGASVVTLHARHVAIHRRRAHAAKLEYVAQVRTALDDAQLHASQPGGHCRVLSNGNVRTFDDITRNLHDTHADGVMVGEPLLDCPHVFAPSIGASLTAHDAMRTYLRLCEAYPLEARVPYVQQHLQSIVHAGYAPSRDTRLLLDTLRAAPSVAAMRAYVDTLA